jgi:hypothetical protein
MDATTEMLKIQIVLDMWVQGAISSEDALMEIRSLLEDLD